MDSAAVISRSSMFFQGRRCGKVRLERVRGDQVDHEQAGAGGRALADLEQHAVVGLGDALQRNALRDH
jgi:hypothetical protein